MGIVGAILGDIAGSKWEYTNNRGRLFTIPSLFDDDSYFTDDTVMSIATMEAILNKDYNFEKYYVKYGKMYPDLDYGSAFRGWLFIDEPQYDKDIFEKLHRNGSKERKPYNSFGNGSAMRVSYIGQHFSLRKDVQNFASQSAAVTHNHPEGIKGAVTIAECVRLAEKARSEKNKKRKNRIKEKILKYGIKQYPKKDYKYSCDIPTSEYQKTMNYDISCMGSVPVAIRCFYETDNFEECMRLICSMNCDADTIGSMAGAICESFYGYCIDKENKWKDFAIIAKYLPSDLFENLSDFFSAIDAYHYITNNYKIMTEDEILLVKNYLSKYDDFFTENDGTYNFENN